MSLQHLFERSPVLPVDAAIPLSRYLRSIRKTAAQADVETTDSLHAALLHIRVVQLICKTLPQHPAYDQPENKRVVRSLRALAHDSFAKLEAFAPPEDPVPTPARLSASVLALFRRLVDPATSLALLAGRVGDSRHVSALVVPAQIHGVVSYQSDVAQLTEMKRLAVLGVLCYADGRVPDCARRALVQYAGLEGFGLLVANDSYKVFGPDKDAKLSQVDVIEPDPSFKLYDLRPLAAARQEQHSANGREP